jgi:hypothetical protein
MGELKKPGPPYPSNQRFGPMFLSEQILRDAGWCFRSSCPAEQTSGKAVAGGFEPPSGDSTDDKRLQAGGLPHIINLFLYPRPGDSRMRRPVPPHYNLLFTT